MARCNFPAGQPVGVPNMIEAVADARALFAQGRLMDAERACTRILEAVPGQVDALYGLGLIYARNMRYAEAAILFQRVLAASPDELQVLLELGTALINDGRAAEAIEPLSRAARLGSTNPATHFNLGNACLGAARPKEALRHYRVALALDGEKAPLLVNLASALLAAGDPAEAIAVCERATARGARGAALELTRGSALRDSGRFEEAVGAFTRATMLEPTLGAAHFNLAQAFESLGDRARAAASFARAAATPQFAAEAEFRLAMLKLAAGDLHAGWPGYERRLEIRAATPAVPPGMARWGGDLDVAGPIVLLTEQGLGDILHSVRYAKLLVAHGMRPWLQCEPRLARLLATSGYFERIVAPGADYPAGAVWYPLESLPQRFSVGLADLPVAVRYLQAEPERVERQRAQLAALQGLRVGIVWSGNRAADRFARYPRALPPDALLPLADVPGVSLVVLQQAAIDDLAGTRLREHVHVPALDEERDAFVDTAALITALDLVISADTAVLHLAGALGAAAFGALPASAHWRWFEQRPDSPFYPSVRLYRQGAGGDWSPVVAAMQAELAALAARGPTRR